MADEEDATLMRSAWSRVASRPGAGSPPIPQEHSDFDTLRAAFQRAKEMEANSPVTFRKIRGGGMVLFRGKFG